MRMLSSGAPEFSRREIQILYLVAADLSDKEIAAYLGISRHTLRIHLSRVYKKHGVHSRAAAVALWLGFRSSDDGAERAFG